MELSEGGKGGNLSPRTADDHTYPDSRKGERERDRDKCSLRKSAFDLDYLKCNRTKKGDEIVGYWTVRTKQQQQQSLLS